MPIPFARKFVLCLLAGLVTAHTFARIGGRFLNPWIPPGVFLAVAALILATAIIFSFVWQSKNNAYAARSGKTFSFWIGLLRYTIAFDLIMVGLQKWFWLQFNTPLAKLDLPFSSFVSEDLAWAFFGRSHAFVFVIGSLQILGSLFLLFSRTRLLGCMVLIPIMLNIALMDIFYQFNPGEYGSAIILLAALIWLLLLDRQKLVALFLSAKGSYPALAFKKDTVKNMARLSAVVIPLAMIGINPTPYSRPWFGGKYTVANFSVNGQTRMAGSCTDSTLTTVYFDQGNECVFEFNSLDKRLFGTYHINRQQDQITVIWHYPRTMHDTLRATLSSQGTGDLGFSGTMGREDWEAVLRKAK